MSIENRYDFVMIFDVENGNPNGDPDAGNAPRMDSETGLGYITDVCLKRKIRNYVELTRDGEAGYAILIKPDKALNTKFAEAYDALQLEKGLKGKINSDVLKARNYMCQNYFDVRTFGAVMSTGDDPCGIVRGPVQLNFATSIDPINMIDVSMSRQARANEDDPMGLGPRKSIVSYAVYRAEGYISAALANKVTGLSEDDVALLWEAIINMFENDHSAARGKMAMRKLYVFKHDSILGNAPSVTLFDKIQISRKNTELPARHFSDYKITVNGSMPNGVTLVEKISGEEF